MSHLCKVTVQKIHAALPEELKSEFKAIVGYELLEHLDSERHEMSELKRESKSMIVCSEPDREPDIILPHYSGYTKVKIWVKENVFTYNRGTWSTIKSGGVMYTDVIEYLELVAANADPRWPQGCRAKIAMEYLAEIALLDDN